MIKFESSCDKCVHNDVCAFKSDIENERYQLDKLEIFRIDAKCKCKNFNEAYHPLIRLERR